MATLLVPWLVFPLVLGAMSLGCALLVESGAGLRLPGPLLLPIGLSLLIVIALFATMNGVSAFLTAPAVVLAAMTGFFLALRQQRRLRSDWWAIASALGVYAVYAAPVVLSGHATFPGYIKLDDDSTFLSNLDRAMHHGRNISGLAPSSYLATLEPHLAKGYPLGSLMPIGVGRELVGGDTMWLYQPTIALYAALLAVSLYELTRRLIARRWLRFLAAFVGAQSALLYGYALWGGIKEVGGAWLIALAAATAVPAVLSRSTVRSFLPLAAASAALLGMLSAGAMIWLVPALAAAGVATLVTRWRGNGIRAVTTGGAFLVILSIPTLIVSPAFLRNRIFEFDYLANLVRPLEASQIVGIWLIGDFRYPPSREAFTYAMVAVASAAAAGGVLWAVRKGVWEVPVYVAGAVASCFAFYTFSTPWIDGKALATVSAAVPFAAIVCAGPLFARGMRTEGAILLAVVTGAVLWSNVLQYHDAWLAPQGQLRELQAIGNQFVGQGPSLITEYSPYAVRHFLRKVDAEGPAELRIRPVPLRNGQLLGKGGYADIDEFQLDAVLTYRTLVLRRSPAESRPPSVYRLVWERHFYQVWERPAHGGPGILEHLPLGNALQSAAVPSCGSVLRLARVAGGGGRLAAVERPPAFVASLAHSAVPHGWGVDRNGYLVPGGAGTVVETVHVPTAANYRVWLGGSFRDQLDVLVDGHLVGSARNQLNNTGQWTPFGAARLAPGSHTVALRYAGPDLEPGSGGAQFAMGPLVLSRTTAADLPVTYVRPAAARTLCGKRLDWVEAIAPLS